MIKIRLTYTDTDKGRKELQSLMDSIGRSANVLQKSEPYAMRGSSCYKRLYIEIESKEQE